MQPRNTPPRHPALALALLAALMLWQFGWLAVPDALAGKVWSAGAAGMVAGLLALVASQWRSREVLAACALGIVWALMTVGCTVAWIIAPWPVLPGQGRCSAAADMPLGLLACAAAGWLAWRIYTTPHNNNTHQGAKPP